MNEIFNAIKNYCKLTIKVKITPLQKEALTAFHFFVHHVTVTVTGTEKVHYYFDFLFSATPGIPSCHQPKLGFIFKCLWMNGPDSLRTLIGLHPWRGGLSRG